MHMHKPGSFCRYDSLGGHNDRKPGIYLQHRQDQPVGCRMVERRLDDKVRNQVNNSAGTHVMREFDPCKNHTVEVISHIALRWDFESCD